MAVPLAPGCAPAIVVAADVDGVPHMDEKSPALAAFVWRDAQGFHLRFTTPGPGKRHFTGSICASEGKLENFVEFRLGPGDHLLHTDASCARWSMRTGVLDGFDFKTASKLLDVDVRVDGFPLSAGYIRVGRKGVNPGRNPFQLQM
jgi:hypothetical protein